MSFLTATALSSQQGNVCLLKLNLFPTLTRGWGGELLALNGLYSILVNIYWLVETLWSVILQLFGAGAFGSINILSHSFPSGSEKENVIAKPQCSIRYKQIFLVLKLAREIQYYLCLYVSQGFSNVWKMHVICCSLFCVLYFLLFAFFFFFNTFCNKAITYHMC